MAARHALGLPTELRLNIYDHLVALCLARGRPTDMVGLFLSCRQVYQEMKSEQILDVRGLLNAQYQWTKAIHEDKPIRIAVRHSSATENSGMEVSVTIPMFTTYSTNSPREPSFLDMVYILLPNLAHGCSVLTLRCVEPLEGQNDGRDFSRVLFENMLLIRNYDILPFWYFGRLVLVCEHSKSELITYWTLHLITTIISIWGNIYKHEDANLAQNAWITAMAEGEAWYCCIVTDFGPDMGTPDGARCQFKLSNGKLSTEIVSESRDGREIRLGETFFPKITNLAKMQ